MGLQLMYKNQHRCDLTKKKKNSVDVMTSEHNKIPLLK